MPPVSSSGSRTALITWSVVFAILFVVSTILAIVSYAQGAKSAEAEATLKKQYADFAAATDLNGEVATQLRDARTTPPEGSTVNSAMSLFQVAIAQRDDLDHMIAGPAVATPTAAQERAKAALASAAAAGKDANITVPTSDNLANALNTVSSGLVASVKQNTDLNQQLTAAKQANADQAAQFEAQRKQLDQQVAAIRAEQQKATDASAAYQQSKDQSVAQISQTFSASQKTAQDAITTDQVKIADLSKQLASANQQIQTLQAKFSDKRVNTEDPIVRHADGHILRIPDKNIVYIDLGAAEAVTPGLTFEVYDRFNGIPPAGDPTNDDNLPRGKASIEVTRVGQGSSECRVTRLTPGQQLSEGDLIANLIYDPTVKYNFVVYGDFDLDRNGVATTQDADVIKRLITQWGGKVMDKVNVDTDFVVLGKEPVLPTFTKDELQDPFNAKKLADAQTASDAYAKVRDTARDLHIPILNQNRFLYLIGYYDQSRR